MTDYKQSLRTSGENISYWVDTTEPIKYTKLNHDEETDVVIVGGGIAGVSIAYNLLQRGKKVILLEDGYIGSGETGRTTAHIVNALDDRYYHLEKLFGEEGAKLAAQSHTAAIDFIEKTIHQENISCSFARVDGYLFLHPSDDPKSINDEFEATQRAGVEVKKISKVPGVKTVQTPALHFKNQAQFHSLQYLSGLCNAIDKKGGKIYTETHVTDVDERGVTTSEGVRVNAKHIVIATNAPINDKYKIHTKQFPYRTYVIGALVKKGSVPKALWWDTGDYEVNPEIPPYHYIRTQEYNDMFDLLIIGGEDHPVGLPESEGISEKYRYYLLEEWAHEHFDIESVPYKWSGQVIEAMDRLAFIGKNPGDDNIYIVTADSGNGITHATIAGMLIPDLITGIENPWTDLYNPSRFKILKAGKTFLKEFVGGFLDYLKYNPKNTDEIELSSIPMGEAKILEINDEKFGAYHDEEGNYHVVKAECTHLGCIIKWNNDEQTWDCPCHGSRFTVEGQVINGPAKENLFYYKEGPHVLVHAENKKKK